MPKQGKTLGTIARKASLIAATATLFAFGGASAADAYQAANGWIASDYVTGFSHGDAAGPAGLIFDGSGNLLVSDGYTDSLYKVAPGGGTAAGSQLRSGYGDAEGLAFDTSGRLYMARATQHDVVELNPASGEVMRTVVSGLPCPVGLATDPVSGDLFVSNVFCPGGGIFRISHFQNGSGTLTRYAGTQDADGLTFGPDGTLYAAAGTKVVSISGTNTSKPGAVSDVANVPEVDGIVFAPQTAQDDAYLVVNRNDGEIDRLDFNGRLTPVLTGASRGDLVTVGPDRCIYADLQDRVIKLGPATGECFFSPPVQPSFPSGSQGVLGERVAARTVNTAIKAKAPKYVRRGSRYQVTLRVADRSSATAHTVIVTDRLPRGTRFVSARSSRGVRCRTNKRRTVLTCRKKTLGSGKTFTIRLVLRALRGSKYTNVANVKSHDLDPVPGNNRAKTVTRVRSGNKVLGVQRRGARLPRTTG